MYRALVVDDVDVIRHSIASQVDDSQTIVTVAGTAENGEKGLEWLETNYADICITDIRMPVIDGLELIKRIRERYPWMASLVISSYDDFSYAKASIQLEAVDYILKPVDEENLEAALRKSVEKIEKDRLSRAISLMSSQMSKCRPLMELWVDYLKVPTKDPRGLIDTTEKKLCEIAGESYYLMSFLAEEWISKVSNEMNLRKPDLSLSQCEKSSTQSRLIKNSNVKDFFIIDCTDKLKYAMDLIKSEFDESKGNQQSRIMDLIIDYIAKNYTRSDFTLQELSDNILFSKNHIANIFKQETGITIWNYIIDLRMKKAKVLLAESMSKSLEIAMSVGYNNYNHFSHLFKECCGISAQEYRKISQGK